MKTRLLLTLTALLLALSSWARTKIDGIYYWLDSSTKTAEVTYTGRSPYSGDIIIPASVSYGGTTYSVTSIGDYAFHGCTGLTSITIPESVTSIRERAFNGCTGLTSITIPSSVTSIGDYAFNGCKGLTSITIPIPSSVTSIGNRAFENCTGLTSITIPSSVTSIGEQAFYNCTGLTSITIPSSVTSIGSNAFRGCTGLTSIDIPESVTSIGGFAFYDCTGLTSITILSSVTSIGVYAFPTSCKLFVSNVGPTVLAIWEKSYTVYDLSTRNVIPKPTLSCSTTQTTATFKMENYNNNFSYKVDNTVVTNSNSIKLTGLKPGSTGTESLYAKHKDASTWYRISERTYTTSNISPTTTSKVTPSSVTLTPSYIKGDANVTSQKLTFNGTTQNVEAGKAYTITGLNPGKDYPVVYTIIANGYTFTYNGTAKTPALTMETQQPKVISAGNVIVAAETNLDEAETNVGFEWRRTDWTDDFSSNSGIAYLYGGTMEGYIRNLYTEKLWKYRPYYEASDGTRYYGNWEGLDPTNTSYFEPTVHTYATINVQSNTASVKGYAMRGTDNVAQQGFKYWKVSSSTRGIDEAGSRLMALDIPAYAQTITASGQVMTATLTNLEYASDYCCVAFVTTTEGETFYGELQTFRTGEDVTGIGHVVINAADEANGTPTIEGYYNLQGQRIAEPQKGIVIVRYNDGTSRKMYVK